jgi:hypothetical protein
MERQPGHGSVSRAPQPAVPDLYIRRRATCYVAGGRSPRSRGCRRPHHGAVFSVRCSAKLTRPGDLKPKPEHEHKEASCVFEDFAASLQQQV